MTGRSRHDLATIAVLSILACAFWLALPNGVSAQKDGRSSTTPIRTSELGDRLVIRDRAAYYKDESTTASLEDVQAIFDQGGFAENINGVDRQGGTDAVYWLRFSLENDSGRLTPLLLYLPHQRTGKFTAYVMYRGRVVTTAEAGFYAPTTNLQPTNRIPLTTIRIGPNQISEIFIRMEDVAYLYSPLMLGQPQIVGTLFQRDVFVYGVILGTLFAAFGYLAIMWRIVPGWQVPTLLAFIVSAMVYCSIASGLSRDLFGFLGARTTRTVLELSIVGLFGFGLLFMRSFLKTKTNLPQLDGLLLGGLALCVALAGGALFAPVATNEPITFANPIFLIIMSVISVAAIRRGLTGARAFLIAALAVFIGSATRNLIEFGAIPLNGFTADLIYIGMALSALTLAVALAEQIRHRETRQDARLGAIVSSSLDAIISLDQNGKVLEFNPAAEKMFEQPRDAVIGNDVADMLIPERLRNAYSTNIRSAMQADDLDGSLLGRRFEGVGQRASGLEFPVEISITSGHVYNEVFYTAHLRDLTDIKRIQSELVEKRDALFQSEKLSALGTLLAGVAHELNNPLTVIVGRAEMMKERHDDEDVKKLSNTILEAGRRCSRIVRTFLSMARHRPMNRQPIDLNELLDGAVEVLGYDLRRDDVVIQKDYGYDLPVLHADPDRLTQVVINLIVNAQQAMADAEHPRSVTLRTYAIGENRQVVIEVDDAGPGISDDVVHRIFDPFFTTKEKGQGTGLGLSISREMIESHDGEISAVNVEGSGARFIVVLPVTDPDEQPAHPKSDKFERTGNHANGDGRPS